MISKILSFALLMRLFVNVAGPEDRVLRGMPEILDPNDIYAADRKLSPAVQNFSSRIYVPNNISNTVSVIDPSTYKMIDTFRVG